MNFEEDNRDFDQIAYHLHSNHEPFHEFIRKHRPTVEKYKNEFEDLSVDMETHFISEKQPEKEFHQKMDLCYHLKNVIQKYRATWIFDIVPTGSSVTGLATAASDLDVAIHIPQAAACVPVIGEKKTIDRRTQLEILQIVRRIILNDENFKKRINLDKGVQLIQAQIQILKIETIDEIECDISVVLEPFLSSMHNSLLIRHFVHIDSRFGPLCAIVKEWAASTEVKKPKEGGFNSYALVLLVIHFLQCGTLPPILPHLQEMYKDQEVIALDDKQYPTRLDFGAPLPTPLPEIGRNNAMVAELFFQFVHYYSTFNFRKNYISMRWAQVMDRQISNAPHVRIQDNKEVYIQDPFDEHNPGRTCRTLNKIRAIFRETVEKFVPQEGEIFKFPTLDEIIHMASSNKSNEEKQEGEDLEDEEAEDHQFTNNDGEIDKFPDTPESSD